VFKKVIKKLGASRGNSSDDLIEKHYLGFESPWGGHFTFAAWIFIHRLCMVLPL